MESWSSPVYHAGRVSLLLVTSAKMEPDKGDNGLHLLLILLVLLHWTSTTYRMKYGIVVFAFMVRHSPPPFYNFQMIYS